MSKTHPGHDGAPLTPSQLVFRDNVAAAEQMPDEMARRLARRRIYLSPGDATDLSAHSRRHRDAAGVWEIDLPAKSTVGLPGLTAERIKLKSTAKKSLGKTHLAAFRPAWADQGFHPKLSGRPDAPQNSLRTLKGRSYRPNDGQYGVDDRTVFHPSQYPWQCIGRVFVSADTSQPGWDWTGSGVLIGSRHVLTAGHLAPWGSRNWAMLFVPGYYDGSSVVGSGADSWVSDVRGLAAKSNFAAHDMCVLRLYDPLGDSLGYFGAKVYNRAWQDGNYWTLVGYPRAVTNERPSYQAGIPVIDNDVDGDAMELEHHGDSTEGDSGGPFFGIWPDGFPYVVGTVSGGETIVGAGKDEDNNICAGGQALVNLINDSRTQWP